MIVDIATLILGSAIFMFVLWKRLKEDYSSNILFTAGLHTLFGLIMGAIVSLRFFPGWWFWTSLTGGVFGFLFAYFRFKLRFFETAEAVAVSTLIWLGLVFLGDAIKNSSLISLMFTTIIATLLGLFIWLEKSYKNFYWYVSGRVGFSGLATLGVFFLIRAAIAALGISMLSFVGKTEVVLSGVTAFVFFLLLFNLSRS